MALVKVFVSTYDPDPRGLAQPPSSFARGRAEWDAKKEELAESLGWPKATTLLWVVEHIRRALHKGDKLYAVHIQGHGQPGAQAVGLRNELSARNAAYFARLLVRAVGKQAIHDPFRLVLGGCAVGLFSTRLQRLAAALEHRLGVGVLVEAGRVAQYFQRPGFEGRVVVCGSSSCQVIRHPKNTYDLF